MLWKKRNRINLSAFFGNSTPFPGHTSCVRSNCSKALMQMPPAVHDDFNAITMGLWLTASAVTLVDGKITFWKALELLYAN